MNKKYKYLNDINFPSDVKKLPQSKLKFLADELREEMIEAVSETGGHLGAGLGVGVVGEESTVGNSCAHAVTPNVTAVIQIAFDK